MTTSDPAAVNADITTDTGTGTTGAETDVVFMQVPADVAYVSTLRLTAASLAARCDLTVDDIEDLRLAVDEACALLLPHVTASGEPPVLSAHFELSSGRLLVETGVATEDTAEPDREGFAWTVLGALTSSVDVRQENGTLTIALTKSREAAGR